MKAQFNTRMFSTDNKSETTIEVGGEEQPDMFNDKEPVTSNSEGREFKAETRKLLDIVAKSIYTDKEVFLRELLSNCSDALEKQRFRITSGQASTENGLGDELQISISTNSKDRTITITDTGVGMTREQICENLGTIAKSGSKEFLEEIENNSSAGSSEASDNIIGQFGVGFYSSFVVSDHVVVYSKQSGHPGVKWVSDGTG